MRSLMVLVFLSAGGVCGAAENVKNWEFKAAEVNTIQVETDSGEIKLAVAEGPAVKAELTGECDAEKCALTAEAKGGKLLLKAEGKKRALWGNYDCKAGFSVTAPAGKKLFLKSGAGNVEAGAFTAGAEVAAGAGNLKLGGLSGTLKLSSGAGSLSGTVYSEDLKSITGAGSVDLAWLKAPKAGKASITTGAGSINLVFPAATKLNIQQTTGVGSFESEIANDAAAPFKLKATTGAGSIRIKKSN